MNEPYVPCLCFSQGNVPSRNRCFLSGCFTIPARSALPSSSSSSSPATAHPPPPPPPPLIRLVHRISIPISSLLNDVPWLMSIHVIYYSSVHIHRKAKQTSHSPAIKRSLQANRLSGGFCSLKDGYYYYYYYYLAVSALLLHLESMKGQASSDCFGISLWNN